MICIQKIWTETDNDCSFLKASIKLDKGDEQKWLDSVKNFQPQLYNRRLPLPIEADGSFTLWYKVPSEYHFSLTTERADAFVVACIYFAMVAGIDIKSDIAVTSCLLFQLNEQLIPLLCNKRTGFKRISVIANSADELHKENKFVGTGISCGVDSFSTIFLGLKESLPKDQKITHLAVFNTGSLNFYGYENIKSLESWREETVRELDYHIVEGRTVASELGLKFIFVDSNIPDLYQGCFLLSHVYRNMSCVLATQKMWTSYHYASAGEGTLFDADLRVAAGSYDIYILPAISTRNLKFYESGFDLYRMEKLNLISKYPVAQRHLNVCSYGHANCGHCTKCTRTLLNLDILGCLDKFNVAFPKMEYYRKNKYKLLTTHVREANKKDIFGYDMKMAAKEKGFKYGFKSDLYHMTYPVRIVRISIIRLLKKIFK